MYMCTYTQTQSALLTIKCGKMLTGETQWRVYKSNSLYYSLDFSMGLKFSKSQVEEKQFGLPE